MNENINNPLGLDEKLYTVEEFAFEIRNNSVLMIMFQIFF
jgi:hypothetical protein